MAKRAAEVALAIAKKQAWKADSVMNNGKADIKTVNTPVFAVDKASVEERIIKTGFHTREAVFGKTAKK
jgi:D-xylose transport system substrate-binding protein